ncbi:MAG: cytochrome b N-terminal domain-containing protein, partial [Thermoanaerobaculia bacterium]|nr:cytochrome b N-terminal domain-containing protein [Thermoanaerobaculia bacterium]
MNHPTDDRKQETPPLTSLATTIGVHASRLRALWSPIDRLFDRVYTSAWNPLYQSGNLVVLFLGTAIVTGIYLFLFYQVGAPHESVARIEGSIFLGSFVRSLHRYSADLALVALVVHLVRKLMQGHTWGPRALAWRSGIVLMFLVLLCGWTGLIMVWDLQGLRLAAKGAQIIDLMPLFSEPIGRSFSGEVEVPSSFFFMNLFIHVALPLAVAAGLWLHVSRVARPALFPPRAIWRYTLGTLVLFSLAVPVVLPQPADLLALPARTPIDLFYSFWLLPAEQISPAALLGLWVVLVVVLWSIPRWWRPSRAEVEPSFVDEARCTGCYQC